MYEFKADETVFYFVAWCVAFACCMARSHDGRHRRWGSRVSVGVATAFVSCGVVGIVLAAAGVAGTPFTSPWPGVCMAAILGSLKERVYTVGWDVLKWFWKGRINFVMEQKSKE